MKLARGIQRSRIVDLNLRYNQLDASCGKTIQGIIAKSQSLERLDLRNNDLKVFLFFFFLKKKSNYIVFN